SVRLLQHRERFDRVFEVLGLPVLVGLFGLAVALGTIGRASSGPQILLSHLDRWGTAPFAALMAVFFNNLAAASLLAASSPCHPFALLVGLTLGRNLFVAGSLAWILWLRPAGTADARPSIWHARRLGVVAVALSMAAALGMLAVTALH